AELNTDRASTEAPSARGYYDNRGGHGLRRARIGNEAGLARVQGKGRRMKLEPNRKSGLRSTLDLDALLASVMVRATELTRADAALITEHDEHSGESRPQATHNFAVEVAADLRTVACGSGEASAASLPSAHEPIQIPNLASSDAQDSELHDALT